MRAHHAQVKEQTYGFSIKTEAGGERLGFINLMKQRKDFYELEEEFMGLIDDGKVKERIGTVRWSNEPVVLLYKSRDKHPIAWIYSHHSAEELLPMLETAEVFRWDYKNGEDADTSTDKKLVWKDVPF